MSSLFLNECGFAPSEARRLQFFANVSAHAHGEDLQADCCICASELSSPSSDPLDDESGAAGTNDPALKLSACGHIFHQSCLLAWTENCSTCPYCRDQMFSALVGGPLDFGPGIQAWNVLTYSAVPQDETANPYADYSSPEDFTFDDDVEVFDNESPQSTSAASFILPFDSGDMVVSERIRDGMRGVVGELEEMRVGRGAEGAAEMRSYWW